MKSLITSLITAALFLIAVPSSMAREAPDITSDSRTLQLDFDQGCE